MGHDADNQLIPCDSCGSHPCPGCDAPAEAWGDKARAVVIGASGVGAVVATNLIIWLSYQDALRRNVEWVLDDRILYGMLAVIASVTVYTWRTKQL